MRRAVGIGERSGMIGDYLRSLLGIGQCLLVGIRMGGEHRAKRIGMGGEWRPDVLPRGALMTGTAPGSGLTLEILFIQPGAGGRPQLVQEQHWNPMQQLQLEVA